MKLPVNFLPILVLLFTACTNNSNQEIQDSNDQKPDSSINSIPLPKPVPNSIETIQKNYEAVHNLKFQGLLDSTGFKYNCNNEVSGTVSYFTHAGRLRMIRHQYNEYDHHEAEDYYYLLDSTLFFVYKKEMLWSFESGPQGATKDNFTEQRVYLAGQEPIKCLEKTYVIRSHANNNPDPDDIANREIKCKGIDVLKPLQQLLKYRGKGTSGCL
jgi:hypothetical protein